MNPANQIAQLRDRLTALENAHALSEAYNPGKWINPFKGMGGVGSGSGTIISKLPPGGTGPLIKQEMQKINGQWYKEKTPGSGTFDEPANLDDVKAAEAQLKTDMAAGSGLSTVIPAPLAQKLTLGWANDPKKVELVQSAFNKLLLASKAGNVMLTIDQANKMNDAIDDESYLKVGLNGLGLGAAAVSILAPVATGITIGAAVFALANYIKAPLNDDEKAAIEKKVRENLNTPPEQLKREIDARYWHYYNTVYKKLKASGATQTPSAQPGSTATAPSTTQSAAAPRPAGSTTQKPRSPLDDD
jgi:hypothetical protein